MNNDRCLTGLPSVCVQHQCIMCKSSKSAPQAPSSLKTEWKKNVLGLLLRCLYLVLSLGQGSPFPPFSKYQGIFSNKLSPNMFATFTVPTCLPRSLSQHVCHVHCPVLDSAITTANLLSDGHLPLLEGVLD